jgi:hypothetical protein
MMAEGLETFMMHLSKLIIITILTSLTDDPIPQHGFHKLKFLIILHQSEVVNIDIQSARNAGCQDPLFPFAAVFS